MAGKEQLCRELNLGHTAIILPCAILHTRQNKVVKWRATWKTSLPCALAQAHGKEWMFAECLGNDTRQKTKRAKKYIYKYRSASMITIFQSSQKR